MAKADTAMTRLGVWGESCGTSGRISVKRIGNLKTQSEQEEKLRAKGTVMGALALVLVAGLAVHLAARAQESNTPSPSVATLLSTGETILGQPFRYPDGVVARVTAAIVTLPPGAQTGWHQHDVPLFGYVLKGELTVTYEGNGERIYRPGEAFMEAIGISHNGRNTGTEPMRILAVFMGSDKIPNTVKSE